MEGGRIENNLLKLKVKPHQAFGFVQLLHYFIYLKVLSMYGVVSFKVERLM